MLRIVALNALVAGMMLGGCDSSSGKGSGGGAGDVTTGSDATDGATGSDATDSATGSDATDGATGSDATDGATGSDATDDPGSTDGVEGTDDTGGTDGVEGTDDAGSNDGTDGEDGTDSPGTDSTDSGAIQVYPLSVPLFEGGTPRDVVASAPGPDGSTHVAWIEEAEGGTHVGYGRFHDGEWSTAQVTSKLAERYYGIDIAVDGDGAPHLVFGRRSKAGVTKNGNFAILYAHGGTGGFSIEQVSANPDNPEVEAGGIFNAYVNDRPQITFAGGAPTVLYLAGANKDTDWDKYIIQASGPGSWARQQLFAPGQVGGDTVTYAVDSGVAVTVPLDEAAHMAWIDISDYQPRYYYNNGSWSDGLIPGYAEVFGNRHIQAELDDTGLVHVLWHHEPDDGPDQVVHATLVGGQATVVDTITLDEPQATNFAPAAVDPADGTPRVVYITGGFTAEGRYLVAPGGAGFTETELPLVGLPCGRQSLHVRNGVVVHVTCDHAEDMLYLTTINEAAL